MQLKALAMTRILLKNEDDKEELSYHIFPEPPVLSYVFLYLLVQCTLPSRGSKDKDQRQQEVWSRWFDDSIDKFCKTEDKVWCDLRGLSCTGSRVAPGPCM